jgi:hypothetical protein
MTICCGLSPVTTAGVRGAVFTLPRTKTLLLRTATDQQETGSNAGARTASPVRRLKQAWCRGQRTVSPTIRPSARAPW